jgi:hypothetical protein
MVTITLSAAGAKNAATRLRDFLATDGITLKHTHAYEALAQTLGYANWNTLQALLHGTPSPEIVQNPPAQDSGHIDDARALEPIWFVAAQRLAEQAAPRTAIAFDPKKFDRFVGCYGFRHDGFVTITRNGDRFFAKLTGQAPVEFHPESETKFFTSAAAAQLSFGLGAQDCAESVVLHQNGYEQFAKRVDPSVAEACERALLKYVADNKPTPERETLLRRVIAASHAGVPNFEDMTPGLAEATKRHWHVTHRTALRLGKLTKLEFLRVEKYGHDIYRAVFENGQGTYSVGPLTPDHKLEFVEFGF